MKYIKNQAFSQLCRILAAQGQTDAYPHIDPSLWSEIFSIADRTYVLPGLHQALVAGPRDYPVPEPMLEALDSIHHLTLARCEESRAQIEEITQALASVNVMPVWLKGAALLTEETWQQNTRLMSDLDVWIPDPGEQQLALDVLAELGYLYNPRYSELSYAKHHHYAPLVHSQRPMPVELHKHVVQQTLGDLLPDAVAKERLDVIDWQGKTIARLSLDDRIMQSLIQCSFMSVPPMDSGRISLMKTLDLVRLLQRTGRNELPASIGHDISSLPWRQTMSQFLTWLERDFGIANPLDDNDRYCAAIDCWVRTGKPPLSFTLQLVMHLPERLINKIIKQFKL
ncbi:MAG: nucleotidyltransferase family protein, partial [Methylobacter sp.]